MVELERKAGYGLVVALSITAMIGTGMFFGPAIAASHAGFTSILSWVAVALIGLYVGSCFSELSSLFPDAGGVYEFAKKAYGRFASFMVGWITWLVGSVTSSLLIVAALDYLIPDQSNLIKISLAIALLLFLTFVALKGVEASTVVLIFFASVTMLVILATLFVGIFHINPDNYVPLFSEALPKISVFLAIFFILETFVGWESATFMGGEVRNPGRVIPKSIMMTSLIVAVLVVIFPLLMYGIVPWQTLANFDRPLTFVWNVFFGNPLLSDLLNISVFLVFIGSAAGGIVSTPRLILALAKDKLFIEQLSSIHRKWKTPYKAIIFQTVVSLIVIFSSFGDYQSLLSLLVPMALMMYILVLLTIPILRKKFPDAPRFIKAPFGRVGPVFISLIYLAIIVTWLLLVPNALPLFWKIISFIMFGVPIYLLLNLYYNPDLLLKAMDSTAFIHQYTERLTLPKRVRREILRVFDDDEGKTVLEYGSGVGALTLPLIKKIGKDGNLFVVDLSQKNLAILDKRLGKKGHKNVHMLHDEHFISRVHPNIPEVDVIYSVGNLSYVQDVRRVLQDMHRLLPEYGKICIVEYVDFFWGIIPNQAWLDDVEKLQALFKEVGFSVRIHKKKALFWKYMYIYGLKSDHDIPMI